MSKIPATPEMIHDRLYHLAKATTGILEKHNIPYSLAYGTLLGAVRHQGFIPWDEDFDLWLFNDSYDEAIEYLRSELPEDMFLEDEKSEPMYFHGWAHVKDLNSETAQNLYPQDSAYSHKGLHIDLYKLPVLKESEMWNYIDNEFERYINKRREKGLLSDEDYQVRLDKLANDRKEHASFKGDPDKIIYLFLTEHIYLEEHEVFPLKRYKFEDGEYLAFNDADKTLTLLYGDYMTPPPEGKRDTIHSEVYIIQ
jgi:lipopolysaccharide cholinephosphotransferase